MPQVEELHEPQARPPEPPQRHRLGHLFNRYSARTAVTAGIGLAAIIGVSDVISSCDGGPIQEATDVGNLGAVLQNVAVPKAQVAIMEGDGTATGEVVSAKYLHVPKVPLLGFLSDAVNGVLEKAYQTSATAKIKTSVELLLDDGALTLKPYKLTGKSVGLDAFGVEADVKVGGLTSVLVQKRPQLPQESSGQGIGSRISDIILGSGDTTQTDNAAMVVAESYFQNVCGRALLGLGAVGVEKYVQNIFKLDAEFYKSVPGTSAELDQTMEQLSRQPVRVVFTHMGRPVNPARLGSLVHNFAPLPPNSQNVAMLVDNTPANVKVPRQFDGCLSTTFAIGQQEKLIQQAAQATGADHAGT